MLGWFTLLIELKADDLFIISEVVILKNRTAFFINISNLSTLKQHVFDKLPNRPPEKMATLSMKVGTIHRPTFVLSSPGCAVRKRLLTCS